LKFAIGGNILKNCDLICQQLADVVLDHLENVKAWSLLKEYNTAYKTGVTGYVVASILVDAYREAGMLDEDFSIRFKKVLHLYKDFINSLKYGSSTTINDDTGNAEVISTAIEESLEVAVIESP
jgi:uncharacterized radical SAM superfamily protein